MLQTKIHIVGIDTEALPEKLPNVLKNCNSVVVSKRFEKLFQSYFFQYKFLKIIPITPLSSAMDAISQELLTGDVTVLASGDPLFFGIGKTIYQRFGSDRVKIYPALSSMQHAFALFKINWDDAFFLSLHGRNDDKLISALIIHKKLGLFTDSLNSPNTISKMIIGAIGQRQAEKYEVHIAENIGEQNERLTTGSFEEISLQSFSSLNVMIIIQKEVDENEICSFGLLEEEIEHSRGLITKNEIRAVAIHNLRLADSMVLWDIGAGSGSVSIEAARLFPGSRIYTIDKERQQIENIKSNRERYKCWNINILEGLAPQILHGLPDPDRIFIGGSGGHLPIILETAIDKLRKDGRIVINCILEKTFKVASSYLSEHGFNVMVSEVQVKRYSYPEFGKIALNPIKIINAVNHGRIIE